MKKFFLFFMLMEMILLNSCSDNSNPTGTGGLGGIGNGGGGGGAVTFTISQQPGTQGIIFFAAASQAVVITSVTVSLPAQTFQDVVPGDGTTVFPANQAVSIREYTGVQTGQKWTFVFVGKLGSTTGTTFNVTTNYTIP